MFLSGLFELTGQGIGVDTQKPIYVGSFSSSGPMLFLPYADVPHLFLRRQISNQHIKKWMPILVAMPPLCGSSFNRCGTVTT
jgi:hypothetical protein